FDHVTICLTNQQVDKLNEHHLQSLPGPDFVLLASDIVCASTPADFDYAAVEKLGFKQRLVLRIGCRVMMTYNHPSRAYVNGTMGTVESITGHDLSKPTVTVRVDDGGPIIYVRPEKFTVSAPNGGTIFQREQLPVTLCFAMTAHRNVGLSVCGVWLLLQESPSKQGDIVRKFWSAPWLQGALYTTMSRVGRSDRIKIFPMRNTNGDIKKLSPVFYMNQTCVAFDDKCQDEDILVRLQRSVPSGSSRAKPECPRRIESTSPESRDSRLESVMHSVVANAENEVILALHYSSSKSRSVRKAIPTPKCD
ncbi:hypothetical protein Pmar_PMAR003205, partial [Perkinsus marinus ATCC 50983]